MIRKFIDDNDLDFGEGSRNTTIMTLVGYAQHLGLGKDELKKEISAEIMEDYFLGQEVDRLYPYCVRNNYKKYWKTTLAKREYKF